MIQRVYEQVSLAQLVDQVVVATDDARIVDHVEQFGGLVRMTDSSHQSGTDRCAEVARQYEAAEWVINVQGDEPFIQPAQIDLLVETLANSPRFSIATLAKSIDQAEFLFNPNVVKVVFSETQGALYFSRHPIPFLRNHPIEDWLQQGHFYKHIGLYGFRREVLLDLAALAPTALEQAESLEQLRWLEHGYRIAVAVTTLETSGIDVPEDLERLRRENLF